jgi:hypothetical protein
MLANQHLQATAAGAILSRRSLRDVRPRSLSFRASYGETSTKLEERSRGGGGKPKAKAGLRRGR